MKNAKEIWMNALNADAKRRIHEAIRDAGASLADAVLDLADFELDSEQDKARVDNARSLVHEWIATGKGPALPPGDLLFAIGIVLDTIKLPGKSTGFGTELFEQLGELGPSEVGVPPVVTHPPVEHPRCGPFIRPPRGCCGCRYSCWTPLH